MGCIATSIRNLRYALAGCAAAMLLAGCATRQDALPTGGIGAPAQSGASIVRGARRGSWMLPEAQDEDLLYASTQTTCCTSSPYDVYVFGYPSGQLVGELDVTKDTTFGICSDAKGHVFVTGFPTSGASVRRGYAQSYIYEYAHGGTKPIKVLPDPQRAGDCSSDPTTGNLAVTNWDSGSFDTTGGGVAIYQHAVGYPKLYTDPKIEFYQYCAYDPHGNLFVDGFDSKGFPLAELAKGASTFRRIDINGEHFHPGSLQWNRTGGVLAIATDDNTKGPLLLYNVTINGGTGNVVGITTLTNNGKQWSDGGQYYIFDGRIIGQTGRHDEDLDAWPFPHGGGPVQAFGEPAGGRGAWWYGVTMSVAK